MPSQIYSVRYIRLRSKVTQNVEMLSNFIAKHNGPGLKITIDLGFGNREDDTPIIPPHYMSVISPLEELREKIVKENGELEIVVRTSASYFGYWLHFLVSESHPATSVSQDQRALLLTDSTPSLLASTTVGFSYRNGTRTVSTCGNCAS